MAPAIGLPCSSFTDPFTCVVCDQTAGTQSATMAAASRMMMNCLFISSSRQSSHESRIYSGRNLPGDICVDVRNGIGRARHFEGAQAQRATLADAAGAVFATVA